MKSKYDIKIKRKVGALIILGLFLAITLAMPTFGWSGSPDGWSLNQQGSDSIEAVYVDSSSKVGIYDTTPDATLEIVDTGATPFMISSTASGDGDFLLMDTNGRLGIGEPAPNFKLEVKGSSGSGYFGVTSSSDGDVFIIDSSGNVGIGTTTPDAKLDVEVSSGGAAEIGNYQCSATGDYAVAMGKRTTANEEASTAIGYFTTASGRYSTAMGWETEASGDYSVAMGGMGTVASGEGSVAIGVLGTEASGFCSIAIGRDADACGGLNGAIGSWVTAGPMPYTYVIGTGVNGDNHLVNNIQKSFMVGFESTTPTLFVDGSSVGIGTTTPRKKLDILDNSGAQLRLTYTDNSVYTDLKTTIDGYLNINPSGLKVGIGTDSPEATLQVGGINAGDWGSIDRIAILPYHYQTTWKITARDDASNAHLDLKYATATILTTRNDGNVGIGVGSPNEKLEVNGKIRANTCFNVAGTDGITQVVVITDASGTHTLTFTGGILTSYNLS